jgi:hypothetical protein
LLPVGGSQSRAVNLKVVGRLEDRKDSMVAKVGGSAGRGMRLATLVDVVYSEMTAK